MGLDENLYTLDVTPRQLAKGTVDLINLKTGDYTYAAYQEEDKIHLCGSSVGWLDPDTEAHLATLTTLPPDKSSRTSLKVLELLSPPAIVEVKSTGSLSWEWSFNWEEHTYSWRRDVVALLGGQRGYTLHVKPSDKRYKDEFPVAVYHPSKRQCTLQVLHYNLDRLDPSLQDRKGQEVLAILSLLSFLEDHFSGAFIPSPSPSTTPSRQKSAEVSTPAPEPQRDDDIPLGLDPRTEALLRARKSGSGSGTAVLDTSSQSSHKGKERAREAVDPNEIEVDDESALSSYASRAHTVLADKSILYLTLISREASLAAATIKLAEEIKRSWYKKSGEELLTFVPAPEKSPTPPPPATSLFRRKSYVPPPPPPTLKVFISRVELGLPNYAPQTSSRNTSSAKKKKPAGPELRPPIVFGQAAVPTTPPLPIRPPAHNGPPDKGKDLDDKERSRLRKLRQAWS